MRISVLIFLFTFCLFSRLNIGFSHPNVGELLCFETTNFDSGEAFINDRKTAYFIFTNCSQKEVIIDGIRSRYDSKKPYGWDTKLYEKIIPSGKKDTIRFYRVFSFQTAGLYDQSFTISYKDSDVKQYLNVFCELKHNEGHLKIDPLKLDTVTKGDTLLLEVPIFNTGTDPIKISPRDSYGSQDLQFLNTYPITILPQKQVTLNFKLNTSDLCHTYEDRILFYSNEETEAHYNVLSIPYSGVLNTSGYASIVFDSLVLTNHLYKGELCIYHFKFKNTGDAPLVISYAKTSCGCLVASYPKRPILPGEADEITVRYDSKRLGPINKSITVSTNACQQNTVLRVKGHIQNKVITGESN